jgi:hypothetical protein
LSTRRPATCGVVVNEQRVGGGHPGDHEQRTRSTQESRRACRSCSGTGRAGGVRLDAGDMLAHLAGVCHRPASTAPLSSAWGSSARASWSPSPGAGRRHLHRTRDPGVAAFGHHRDRRCDAAGCALARGVPSIRLWAAAGTGWRALHTAPAGQSCPRPRCARYVRAWCRARGECLVSTSDASKDGDRGSPTGQQTGHGEPLVVLPPLSVPLDAEQTGRHRRVRRRCRTRFRSCPYQPRGTREPASPGDPLPRPGRPGSLQG